MSNCADKKYGGNSPRADARDTKAFVKPFPPYFPKCGHSLLDMFSSPKIRRAITVRKGVGAPDAYLQPAADFIFLVA